MSKKSFEKRLLACVFLFVVATCVGTTAVAQSVRGAISGSVTDPSGALIPNATVTATNQGTGGKTVTHTTGAGVYHFPDLPIGTYTVTATAAGFATNTSTGVLVQVNSTTALNISLASGAVTEVITVDAQRQSGCRPKPRTSAAMFRTNRLKICPCRWQPVLAACARRNPSSSFCPALPDLAAEPAAALVRPTTVSSSHASPAVRLTVPRSCWMAPASSAAKTAHPSTRPRPRLRLCRSSW